MSRPKILVLQPHELSVVGLVGAALEERGAHLTEHVLSSDGEPPPLDGFDAVLVMGAPWSVYGDEVTPWIDGLLGRLREAVDRDLPVLGVCFGAQAFAQALGGEVMRAADHEVGRHEVETEHPSLVPAGPWFMWHGDTFTPPPGARVIARTAAGPQAYTYGPHLLVQFHPEATAEVVAAWLRHDDDDFGAAGVDPDATLEALRADEPAARERADRLVAHLFGGG